MSSQKKGGDGENLKRNKLFNTSESTTNHHNLRVVTITRFHSIVAKIINDVKVVTRYSTKITYKSLYQLCFHIKKYDLNCFFCVLFDTFQN